MDYICNFSPFFGNLSGKESLPLASVQKRYLLVEMIDINSYHKQTKKKNTSCQNGLKSRLEQNNNNMFFSSPLGGSEKKT